MEEIAIITQRNKCTSVCVEFSGGGGEDRDRDREGIEEMEGYIFSSDTPWFTYIMI